MLNSPPTPQTEQGLLEQPALFVAPADASGRRPLLAPDGREVGFAVWRKPRWWRGYTLSIHEREDSPLVFTVARSWLWPSRREVRDAEGERIGELAGRRVFDRWGDAVMSHEGGRMTDFGGVVLASWSGGAAGTHLEFRPEIRPDPFACMLVLAALLVGG